MKRTFVAVDFCNNRTTCQQVIWIDDTTDPILNCPTAQTIEACGVYSLETEAQAGFLEYSESIRFLTELELQGAGGDAMDNCAIDSLYYFDSQSGS